MREALAPPGGNPTALAEAVDRYEATERAIAAAADELMHIIVDGNSASIAALGDKARAANGHLVQAHGRYQGTRSTLRAYTVDLESFHVDAQAAVESEQAARRNAHDANEDLTDAARHARSAAMNPEDQATIDHWQTQAVVAHHRVDSAEEAMAAAQAEYSRALEALDQAARRAIDLIEASFDGTNDSRLDRLRNAIAEVASFLSSLATWVTDVFSAAFELIVEAVARFVEAVLITIAVLALIAIVAVALASMVVVLLAVLELILYTAQTLILVGVLTYGVATELGVDDLTRIRMVLAAMAVACPALGLFLVTRIAGELFKPAPKVTPLDVGSLDDPATPATTAQQQALAQLEANEPDSVDDFLSQAGAVDTIGADVQTVVDIAKIVHEDGSVSWIVTLPSTKDWVVPTDAGAVNDLDADLVLLAFPELQSQYEKAVLDAMDQAGIGAGEPVLVTGWSLGGIMAGHLAETGGGGYDYAGVVVAGAPIDHMSISADIPVIQVKHMVDPVHRTDMIDFVPDSGSHISLWDGERSGIGLDRKTDTFGHNAPQYIQTLKEHVAADESVNDAFSEFYVVDDPNRAGAPTIEHNQYAFSE